ncbi:MAG: cytochrome P450 [Actinobacteria bacterium]|nr:MAG: cytochrome P450 [Actinomycetota bacterium]
MSTHAATEAPVKQAPAQQKLPPGPRLPRFLQTIAFILAGPRFLEACRRRYGGAVTLGTLFDDKFVMLFDPALVKELFQGPHDQLRAGEANALLGPVLGQRSVLLLDGSEHLRHRKLMLPHLHGQRMQAYAQTIQEATDREIDSWPLGEPFALLPTMQSLTLQVIMRAVFGYEPGPESDELRSRLRAMVEPLSRPRGLPLMMLLGRLGSDRRGAAQQFDARRREVDEILFGEIARRLSGHETTATGLAWTFDLVLHSPEVLAKARVEGDEYLDAAVKEALRIRPVIPGVGRVVRGEPFRLNGYVIPPGVEINPSIRMIHRRPDVYPDPAAFRPERFLSEDAPDTYTWVPFGGGTRRCLGASFALMEMRIVLARVLERVPLRPADPERERVQFRAITLSPRNGTRVIQQSPPASA